MRSLETTTPIVALCWFSVARAFRIAGREIAVAEAWESEP